MADAAAYRIVSKSAFWALVVLALFGVLLLLVSSNLDPTTLWHAFTRELGVVVLTVSGVSLIHESFVAEKHFEAFRTSLQEQIERGESNAAMCERLGIRHLYLDRKSFETANPLGDITKQANGAVKLRIVAKSLFFVMIKSAELREALLRGATIQLCCLNPDRISPVLAGGVGLQRSDITGALERFRREFDRWAAELPPLTGDVEIRMYDGELFDSLFSYQFDGQSLGAWDLSFGPDLADKRVFILETTKGFGRQLQRRYDSIWASATKVFSSTGTKIVLDSLPS